MIGKTTTQKVLNLIFKYDGPSSYPREIARTLNLSMSVILSAVKKLEKEKLIKVTRLKAFHSIVPNYDNLHFFHLKRVFNLEQLYESGLIEAISKSCGHPQAIILFGSYSRGEDNNLSDIDIAVIQGTEKNLDFSKYEKQLERKISLHFVDLKKASQEFKSNLYNGIVLEGAL